MWQKRTARRRVAEIVEEARGGRVEEAGKDMGRGLGNGGV